MRLKKIETLPTVSVIIPTFNSGGFLKEAVDSALQQTYPNLEIIVIDDGSSDDSIELLQHLSSQLTIIRKENYGAASARNLGILQSTGEFIAFLDSDDVWNSNKIMAQVSLLREKNLDLVYCWGQEMFESNKFGKTHQSSFEGNCYQFYKKYPTRDIFGIGPSGVLLKRALLCKSGIFDTSITPPTEDWDFFRRYSRFAKIGFCPEVLTLRRIHSANISNVSLIKYYHGNRDAIRKMFADDDRIRFVARRVVWGKFHLMMFKSFFKKRRYMRAAWCMFLVFIPAIF